MLDERFRAVDLCIAERLHGSALILIYSLIDNLASLDRDVSHLSTTRQDFIAWVDKFVIGGSTLPCTGKDLYAARCGLLHAYEAESDLSKKGEAAPLFYAWGTASASVLDTLIQHSALASSLPNASKPKAIQVEKLIDAVKHGTEAFISEVGQDKQRMCRIFARARKVLSNMPNG